MTQTTEPPTTPVPSSTRTDWILGLKIMLDAVLGSAQATVSTIAAIHTVPNGSHVQATLEEFQWAFLIAGLPALLLTLKARIATGLPNLPLMGTPGTASNPLSVKTAPGDAVTTHEEGTP